MKNTRTKFMHPSLQGKSSSNIGASSTDLPTSDNTGKSAAGDKPRPITNIFAAKPQPSAEEPSERKRSSSGVPGLELVKKFPRPLIFESESSETFKHNSSNFEDPPKSYYNFQCEDSGNATCRFARSTMYMTPETSSAFEKSGYKFSVVLTPFAEPGPGEKQIPLIDKKDRPILRCERCGTFSNPFFVFKLGYSKYTCNICKMEGNSPAGFEGEQMEETQLGVYDFLMPDSYRIKNVVGNDILICLDMSYESLINGSFLGALSNLQVFIDSMDPNTNLGFVLFDNFVTFLRITKSDDGEIEISMVRNIDGSNAASLSRVHIFYNVQEQREIVEYLISFLSTYGEKYYSERHTELKNTSHDINALSRTLVEMFDNSVGHAIIFTSVGKRGNSSKKVDDKGKSRLQLFSNRLTDVARRLCEKGVTVSVFGFGDLSNEIEELSSLPLYTSGRIFYYPQYNTSNGSEKFYYDLFRVVTCDKGSDVVCRMRVSSGLQIANYHTPIGKIHTLDFQLPSLNQDQYVIANLQIGENLKDRDKVYVQFVILYTALNNDRVMRIINLGLKTVPDMVTFYKTLDCDAYLLTLLRELLEMLSEKNGKEAVEELLKQILRVFRYYRNELGQSYNDKEFALADKLKFLPLYISSVLSAPCFLETIKADQVQSAVISFLNLIQNPISVISYYLYPKIFDISAMHSEFIDGNTNAGTLNDSNTVILPTSIPANMNLILPSGVYLIDTGVQMILSVRSLASKNLIQDLFNCDDYIDVTTSVFYHNPETEFSNRFMSIVERLRGSKAGPIQSVFVIKEEDSYNLHLKSAFIENHGTYMSSDYWDFLSKLHVRVRDL